MAMYKATTRGFEVRVEPLYLEHQSAPEEDHYLWAYTITITNHSPHPAQLLARHWRIVDGLGRLQEVRGAGVVGEQPLIEPGDSFTYTSGVPLSTPSGIMSGSYRMRGEDGETFEIEVPAFSLDLPERTERVN